MTVFEAVLAVAFVVVLPVFIGVVASDIHKTCAHWGVRLARSAERRIPEGRRWLYGFGAEAEAAATEARAGERTNLSVLLLGIGCWVTVAKVGGRERRETVVTALRWCRDRRWRVVWMGGLVFSLVGTVAEPGFVGAVREMSVQEHLVVLLQMGMVGLPAWVLAGFLYRRSELAAERAEDRDGE